MTERVLLIILLIHYLADFGLQTHEQSKEKYKGGEMLFYHVGVYSLIWFFGYLFIEWNLLNAITFTTITFVTHWVTDLITSNLGRSFWKKEDFHNGFVIIGFDQILHYIQLYITIKWLIL